MSEVLNKPLSNVEKRLLSRIWQHQRGHFASDNAALDFLEREYGYSRSSFYKYRDFNDEEAANVEPDALKFEIQHPLEIDLPDFAPDAPIELEGIGQFSKKVEGVESLASEDFEVKPARDLRREVLEMLPEMPTIPKEGARWLVLPDIHVPLHDAASIKAVLEYASEIEWAGCLQLGDLMDFDFISRFTKENMRALETRRFLDEYDAGNRLLDDLVAAVRNKNKNAHITILEGNHDWRVENVVDKAPALEGLIEMETNLHFGERKIDYWRYWTHKRPYIIGKAWFIHGLYVGGNHAKKTADNFHRNVFYGHTHDRSSHNKTTFEEDAVMCESLGALCVRNMPYMGKNPSNWIQCFAEFFFRGDGTFNHYVTNILDNRFIAINGKEYGRPKAMEATNG